MAFIYLCMYGDMHVCPYVDVRRRPAGTDSFFPPVASKNQMGYQGLHLLSSLSLVHYGFLLLDRSQLEMTLNYIPEYSEFCISSRKRQNFM